MRTRFVFLGTFADPPFFKIDAGLSSIGINSCMTIQTEFSEWNINSDGGNVMERGMSKIFNRVGS